MNHLAHLAIADAVGRQVMTDETRQGLIVGGFLADDIKGRLKGDLPAAIEAGIQLHRSIDAFTDQHPLVREAQTRLPSEVRRYAGIVTDILFDHLLARQWRSWYHEPLPEFSTRTLGIVQQYETLMPDTAQARSQRMARHNSLAGYGREEFVTRSLVYLSGRLTRSNPLAASADACLARVSSVEGTFNRFYPQLIEFSEEWVNKR